MKTMFPVLFLNFFLAGCAAFESSSPYKGSGVDALPQSECEACKKEPFYVEGKWVRS